MRRMFVAFGLAIGLFALVFLGWGFFSELSAKSAESAKKIAASQEGPYFVSFFWVGANENDCRFRNTLLTDTPGACVTEYNRFEVEIKKFVKAEKAKGLDLKWDVIARCKRYDTYQSYADDINKLTDKCAGK